MQEKTLIKIGLICSIAGISALIIISMLGVRESSLNNIRVNDDVRINGVINSISRLDSATVLDVENKCSVKVVLFGEIKANKGDNIQVTGRVENYQGEKEIIVDEARVW